MARRVRGQGSVRFKDGRWEWRVAISRKRYVGSCPTEREAWLEIAKARANPGAPKVAPQPTPAATFSMRFDDLCSLYKRHRLPRWKDGLAGGSAQEFDSHVDGILTPAFGSRPIHSITPSDIQQFVDSHVRRPILHRGGDLAGQPTGRTLSPVTLNKYVRILKAVFKYAFKMEWIAKNPTIGIEREKEPKKRRKRKARTMRLWELQAILSRCLKRHRLYLTFLALTGLRRSEASRCTWDWVDLDEAQLTVLGPKVAREDPAIIPMPPQLVALLRAVPQDRRMGHLFTWRIGANGVGLRVTSKRKAITSSCVRAGVDPHGVAHHSFRYTFSSLLEDFGAPRAVVRTLLRHDPDGGETTDLYVEATPEKLRHWVGLLAERVLDQPVVIPIQRAV